MRIIGGRRGGRGTGGDFHHLVPPGTIPDRFLLHATADDPGSTPPLPPEHIHHLHSPHTAGEGGREGGGSEGWLSLRFHFTRIKQRGKERRGGTGGASVVSVGSSRVAKKKGPRRQTMTYRVCVCGVDFLSLSDGSRHPRREMDARPNRGHPERQTQSLNMRSEQNTADESLHSPGN